MNGPAYYNEHDPFAAAWLRNLIAAGHIAPGVVDERDIRTVKPSELDWYSQHHFFAGIGGWSYALRLAGWPDDRPVWTGSCPCQPFSAAGKRKGFADDRHLWPTWAGLIAERKPPVVFGEQVASAAGWLRLVRGDLEALGYAVGATAIEAASAGADHLRDRFWFVADGSRQQVGAAGQPRQYVDVGDATRHGRRENDGPVYPAAGGGEGRGLIARSSARNVADADQPQRWVGDEQPAGQQPQPQPDSRARDGRDMADGDGQRKPRRPGEESEAPCSCESQVGESHGQRDGVLDCRAHEWVVGADGKARRVKPGIRLLVDGFPARVGLLRGFGNAIDPRPASQFIAAYLDC